MRACRALHAELARWDVLGAIRNVASARSLQELEVSPLANDTEEGLKPVLMPDYQLQGPATTSSDSRSVGSAP